MIYLVPLPETKLDRRGRVAGWAYHRLDRDGEKQLDRVAKMLSKKNVARVEAADIHNKPAEYLSRKLGVPVSVSRKLRGFNFGRISGHKVEEVNEVLAQMVKRWEDSIVIPIAGGDSWVSYQRRFWYQVRDLLQSPVDIVLLLEVREIAYLLTVGKQIAPGTNLLISPELTRKVDRCKVYVLKNANPVAKNPATVSD